MMNFQPEIVLPENLEIDVSQEILDYIKENILELKFITIKKYIQRDEYKQIMRISFQEPKETSQIISETIYKILQYDNDAKDICHYKINVYRKTDTVDKITTKHITVIRKD